MENLTREKYYNKYRRYENPEHKWFFIFTIIVVILLKVFNLI